MLAPLTINKYWSELDKSAAGRGLIDAAVWMLKFASCFARLEEVKKGGFGGVVVFVRLRL